MMKLVLDYTELIPQRKGRIATWFPITLAVTGSFALLVGIFVAVLSIPEVVAAGHPTVKVPSQQGAMYIGTNTCFTCHGERPWDWSLTLYTQTIVDAPEKPMAVANLKPGVQVQQINTDEMVEAYTTADNVGARQDPTRQYYVIKTEDGHILLPSQKNAEEANTDDALGQCMTCHTSNIDTNPSGSKRLTLAIEPRPVQTIAVVIYPKFNKSHDYLSLSDFHKSRFDRELL